MATLSDRRPVVLNPGGGSLQITDADALLQEHHAAGEEPMIDLGAGMIVALEEMLDPDDEDEGDK